MSSEIRLLDPAGLVAEVHPCARVEPCAITQARILLDIHREMAGAQLRRNGGTVEIACETGH